MFELASISYDTHKVEMIFQSAAVSRSMSHERVARPMRLRRLASRTIFLFKMVQY